jgi:ribulose-5-phosphate 4-epimerase/fuculose-1-phosphate aldolase
MTSRLVTPSLAKNDDLQRRVVCTVGRWMYQHEFIVPAQGNVSVRLRNGNILMSPTGVNKDMLGPGGLL